MKALNDVQGAGSPANGSSHSPAPESLAPSAAASQPSGDYFELFAGPKQSQGATLSQAHAEPVAFAAQEPGWAVPVAEPESEASASLAAAVLGEQSSGKMNLFARRLQQATAQTEVSPEEPMQAPAGWPQTLPEQQETGNGTAQPEAEPVMPLESSEAVMPMAGLPAEQPARTEPGASGGEYQADTWSILPAGSTDGEQVPEQPPIQMAAQPSLLQAEAPEAAQPEVTSDNQATAAPEANTVPEAVPDATPPSGAADPKALAYGWTLPAATAEPQPEASGQSDTVHMQRAENLDALAQPREAEASQNGEADAGGQIAELEEQVRRSVAALARATADLAAERGERQRSEQRTVRLTARLQELHEELGGALQAQRESLQRISALEGQLGQTDEALARRTADLEQQQADRRLAEEQLRKARELNAQLRQDLAFLDDANKGFNRMQNELAAKLEASRSAVLESETKFHGRLDERQNQVEVLDTLQRELQKHARKTESLEKELQTTSEALRESEARCQQEAAERQRLNAALTAAELNLRDRSTRSDLEFCKLESALQVEQAERNRQERQLARARQASADSLRAVRALRKSLRRQIREPIDNLYHSARHLLELEMGQEQKQLAQAVLQDVLLVHTRLREPETPSGEASDTQTALATKPV
jgi:hypothetical protein